MRTLLPGRHHSFGTPQIDNYILLVIMVNNPTHDLPEPLLIFSKNDIFLRFPDLLDNHLFCCLCRYPAEILRGNFFNNLISKFRVRGDLNGILQMHLSMSIQLLLHDNQFG